MPANPNWTRWLFSSMANYLKQVATEVGIPSMVEGLDLRTDAFMQSPDRVEIRFTGPFTRELSKGYYEIRFDANVLITSRFDVLTKNRLDFARFAGRFHEALDMAIAIYQHGNQPGDDSNALVGCLSPLTGRNDAVRVFHFGQLNPTDKIQQSAVDARYVMEIYDNETS